MRSALIAAFISAAVADVELQRRDAASDFSKAADMLISSYIPDDRFASMTSVLGSAASAASVTGDIASAIFSALKETEVPSWFEDNVPDEFQDEVAALESAIDDLRPIETVVEVTTTNSDGSTITTSVSTTMAAPMEETSVVTTVVTDESGSEISTTFTTTATTTPTSSSDDEEGGDDGEGGDEGLACMPTAMAHAAAGVAALIGVAMVL